MLSHSPAAQLSSAQAGRAAIGGRRAVPAAPNPKQQPVEAPQSEVRAPPVRQATVGAEVLYKSKDPFTSPQQPKRRQAFSRSSHLVTRLARCLTLRARLKSRTTEQSCRSGHGFHANRTLVTIDPRLTTRLYHRLRRRRLLRGRSSLPD